MREYLLIRSWFIIPLIAFLYSEDRIILQPNDPKITQISKFQFFIVQDHHPAKPFLEIPGLGLEPVPLSTQSFQPPPKIENLPPLSNRDIEFDKAAATHLLRRTVFGPKVDEINQALNLGLTQSVTALLNINPMPDPPGIWVNEPFPDEDNLTPEELDSLFNLYYVRMHDTRNWWLDLMIHGEANLREMMVLFWHDHFATSSEKVIFPPAMYHQNDLMREHALGNFKTLVREMAYDPAMLIWLDNNQNVANAINENFTRELLELFTIGVGNYSQEDIVEAARAFTGWVTDGLATYFIPSHHDYREKTFMGQTGNWNGDDIIDIIFEQDETVRFICRKLYQWFVYYTPDDAVVEEMAVILRENDYEILPVLEVLFTSEHFYNEHFRGAKYRGPIYYTAGTIRQLYIDDEPLEPGQQEHILILHFQELFGQLPLYPPDVSGWTGYRSWINTYSLPYRKLLTNGFIDGYIYEFELGFNADVIALSEKMSNPNDPDILIEDFCQYFYSIQPSQAVKDQLVLEMLDGSEPYDWSIYQAEAEGRLKTVIKHMLRLGEYQLR